MNEQSPLDALQQARRAYREARSAAHRGLVDEVETAELERHPRDPEDQREALIQAIVRRLEDDIEASAEAVGELLGEPATGPRRRASPLKRMVRRFRDRGLTDSLVPMREFKPGPGFQRIPATTGMLGPTDSTVAHMLVPEHLLEVRLVEVRGRRALVANTTRQRGRQALGLAVFQEGAVIATGRLTSDESSVRVSLPDAFNSDEASVFIYREANSS